LAGKQVIAIAGGGSHGTALCADSTIAAWGYGIYGALGNGGSANSSVPVAVTRTGVLAGKTVTAIANSQLYCLAMCSDRTLVSWGYNNGGLGNGVSGDAKVPVSVVSTGVLSGKTPVMIAASYPSYALCSDGTMAAWGDNQRYQYGNGTSNSTNVPTATSLATLGTGEKLISLGVGCYAAHTLAIAAVPWR
jgi:alpha-tubulin suppressor-like RCC1 family protein